MVLRGVLDYIRSIFEPHVVAPRKRRAEDFEDIKPKLRKSEIEREIPIRLEKHSMDRNWFAKIPNVVSRKPLRVVDTIVLNDDDDDVFCSVKPPNHVRKLSMTERPRSQKFTSTPDASSCVYLNGNGVDSSSDDDVKFVREYISPKKKDNSFNKFNYKTGDRLFNIGVGSQQNGTKFKPKVLKKSVNSPDSKNATTYFDASANGLGSTLEQSFRLTDKMNYRKLLDAHMNNTLNDSVNNSRFMTPMGKSFHHDSFSNKSAKPTSFGQPKERTKDMIIKVLDSYSSKETSVKDSDSDDVILVSPPSPKPDIKVEPVNSLKKIVDTSQVSRKDWLEEIVERHRKSVTERQQEVDEIRQSAEKQSEINRDIKVELLRRDVERSLQLKEVILPVEEAEEEVPLPELTPDQINMVKRAWRGDPSEVLARKFNLNITRRDLCTLAGLNWLNDEVINFYMNLIIERGTDPKWPNVHCFNTFFYVKLLKDGPESLRRWTRKIDIFAMDLVCVPIHMGMHWCMAIIDFRDKSIRYYDSMGSPNYRCLEALQGYIEAEHLDKKKTALNAQEFLLENREDIPQQMNGSDCGMFACTFAEFISRNGKITFSQEDMPYLRKKMVVEIMSGTLLIK